MTNQRMDLETLTFAGIDCENFFDLILETFGGTLIELVSTALDDRAMY